MAFESDGFVSATTRDEPTAGPTVPTLLLAGSESPPFHHATSEALDEALPNSRIVTFDGHGHVARRTATDRFVDELLAFVHETN